MLTSWNPRVQHGVAHKNPPLNLALSRCIKSSLFRLVSLTSALRDFYSSVLDVTNSLLSCECQAQIY